MRQVAEQTIEEVENASSKVKLKWGGSEARNRRRLPASDDVATLLQNVSFGLYLFETVYFGRVICGQDGRLGEYAFFALRSLLDIQNFLIQRQKKYMRVLHKPPNTNLPMTIRTCLIPIFY
jgi:hypothetical protein